MPKMKTNRGAAKRFSFTATGKVKRGRAYHRHILEKKSPGQKRRLRSSAIASAPDTVHIKRMLPYK